MPNQSGSINFKVTVASWSNIPIKNKIIANAVGDKYLANNISEAIIYPLGWSGNASTIGDKVWSDTNFNGIQNVGEPGIRNIIVELISCTGNTIIDTSYSDNNGYYSFTDVPKANYKIRSWLPAGYIFTYWKVWIDDSKDSDITLGNTSNCFVFAGSGKNLNKDIGLYDIRNYTGTNFCNYNGVMEKNLWEQCDGDDGVFGNTEKCIACNINKLYPNCGDGVIQPWESCDCNSVLPAWSSCVECQIVGWGVCGNGKLEGLEECETTSQPISGLQCVSCRLLTNNLWVCGNGTVEVWEMCDLGSANGSNATIPSGTYKDKNCSMNCNVSDNKCNIISNKTIPECTQVISPNIMEGEYLPFRWDISNNQIINSKVCSPGKIPADTVFCSFALYAGWSGTTSEPLTLITLPCVNPSSYDKPLLTLFPYTTSSDLVWLHGSEEVV